MDFYDKIKKFFDFELSLNENELQYWDIFRHDLFLICVYNSSFETKKEHEKKKSILNFLKNSVSCIFEFIKFPFIILKNKRKRILFQCSRYKINDKFVDVNTLDFYELYKNDFFCIETYFYTNYVFSCYKKIVKKIKKYKKNLFSDFFVTKINNYFGISLDLSFYNNRIIDYYIEMSYYMYYFNLLKPKSIFFIQNGIHKGMIKAAKLLHIPISEIQHGEIGMSHPAYFYPKGFSSKNIIAADYLFVWSEYWKQRINFPGVTIFSSGNSYYSYTNENMEHEKCYSFVIISNSEHTPIFDKFLEKLFKIGYNGSICYKLHSNQKNEFKTIKTKWQNFKNLEVVLFEKNVLELLSMTDNVLVIHSTVVFQALNNNKKVLLYSANEEYLSHKDVFDDPNLYIVNDVMDFIFSLNKPVCESKDKYYEKFDKENNLNFLNQLGL
ncbi:MAG: hypothetical protein J6B63_05330 [Treponema sp.]|nr:hypothetical protein [Treponema sp.]